MKRLLLALPLFALATAAGAGEARRLVLRADPAQLEALCAEHGLRQLRPLGRSHVVLVAPKPGAARADLLARLEQDPRVLGVEEEQGARLAESARLDQSTAAILDQSTAAILDQSTAAILDQSTAAILDHIDRSPTDFFGSTAWASFAEQGAGERIGLPGARARGQLGKGVIVAVIDTGADTNHPLLRGALLPGYDFTRERPGSSEWADLDQSTAAILDQSTAAILDQSTAAILDQSTAAILDQSTAAILDGLPPAFGHGTMVASLIRLVAPAARVLPLKAFGADGSSSNADILRAIYWAVDHGARVINMSFSTDSREVRRAIEYASSNGVLCISSAGNSGSEAIVFPAAFRTVLGVAATTLEDDRAPFSNYGQRLVSVAAPGVNLLAAWPGGRYALVSGTSFSTGLVSGASALLAGADPEIDYRGADEAFSHSVYLGRELGWGRIDVPGALDSVARSAAHGVGQRRQWTMGKRGN
jgi:subtilisin family serine protease